MDHKKEQLFHTRYVEQVYSQLPGSLLATLVCCSAIVYVLWAHVDLTRILYWFVSVCVVLVFRFLSCLNYNRQFPEKISPSKWGWIYLGGLTSTAVILGAASFVLFPHESVPHQMFLAFVLGGLVAGSMASTSLIKYSFYVYSFPVLLPLSFRFFITCDEIHMAMGAMLLVYLVFCIFISHHIYSSAASVIGLQLDKEDEIERRKSVEDELRRHKQHLERLVEQRTTDLARTNIELKNEIVDRETAEKALLESREQFRTIIENIPEVIYRCELNSPWKVDHISENIFSLSGYRAEEFMSGKIKYADLIHPQDLAHVKLKVHEGIAEHKAFEINYRIIKKDKSIRFVFERGRANYDSHGTPQWLDGVISDFTERRKIEENEQKMKNIESLGVLAGGLAHDFNNLLMGVFGNIELAKEYVDRSSAGYEFLQKSSAAIDKARQLTGQLLTFAKGGMPFREKIALDAHIKNSANFIFSGSTVKIVYHFQEDLWAVEIDPGQMDQVLQNVFMNAKEAMPEGGSICIHGENVEISDGNNAVTKGKYVKISIMDEGIGIDPDVLPNIFDPYFTTKAKGAVKGTGLGLALCYSIITKHRGFISAESEPGKGTTLHILLPAVEKKIVQPENSGLEKQRISDRAGRILVLEDEQEVAQVVRRMLSHLGYEFEIAEEGSQAVECFLKARMAGNPFDFVILDLTIRGGMGGRKTIELLREIDPDVKAVVASGYADDIVMSNFQKYGFVASLTKPYTLQSLQKILDHHL